MNKILLVFKVVLVIVGLLVLIFFFSKDMVFTGQLELKTDFTKFTPAIFILTPQERVVINDLPYIIAEPVYFEVNLPRYFDHVELEFDFLNKDNHLIEVGLQIGDSTWDLKPLENKKLDQLDWPKVRDGNLTLWQRQEKYETINQFFQDLPLIDEIAVYNYNLVFDFDLPGYQSSEKIWQLDNQLIGSYEYYTYLKDEDLYLEIELESQEDLTQDNTFLNVYNMNNEVLQAFYAEDNKITAQLSDLTKGVYKVGLQTLPQTKTISFKTTQQKISWQNKLKIVEPANLITDSQNLTFTAFLADGVQKIEINKQQFEIADVYQQYKVTSQAKLTQLNIPNGNLEVSGESLFAFEEKQFFNPLVDKIRFDNGLPEDKNYLLAFYQTPQDLGADFKRSKVEFDLIDKYFKDGKLKFIISVPGILGADHSVVIKSLKIKLNRPTIWQEGIINNIKNYRNFYLNELN